MSQVEIYTTGYCPYCHRAKALLEQKRIAFNEIRIDLQPELRPQMIERANGGTSVPQIFIGTEHIGGCDDMFALETQNKLDPLLAV